ncbi:MAG TPA: outer membrane lipoprotein LolB [Gammaproteobacteria bacterium]|nr:outer membrane lipoprotein LolB [Gammaproteobacteria bacterium]
MRGRSGAGLVGCLLLGALLGGCATAPTTVPPAPEATWQAHRAAVAALQHWQARGRIAVRAGEEGWNAAFDWQQRGDSYLVRLRGPFGQGGVELRGDPRGVWLRRNGHPPVFATDPETLLVQQTGWRLPLSGLGAWLKGMPERGQDRELQWDSGGRLLRLQQRGWHIDYQGYGRIDGVDLPRKLKLKRDSLEVRLVIDRWQVS